MSAASLLTPRTGSGSFLRTLFGGLSAGRTSANSDRVCSVYELSLRRGLDTSGSPGVLRRRRKVLDTSGFYVRGEEEYLRDWRPRGDSLLIEHQWVLERIHRIHLVEKVRHILLVRSRLADQFPAISMESFTATTSISNQRRSSSTCNCTKETDQNYCSCNRTTIGRNPLPASASCGRISSSSSRSNLAALASDRSVASNSSVSPCGRSHSPIGSSSADRIAEESQQMMSGSGSSQLTDRQWRLLSRCVQLMQLHLPSRPPPTHLSSANGASASNSSFGLSTSVSVTGCLSNVTNANTISSNTIIGGSNALLPGGGGSSSAHTPLTPELLSPEQCVTSGALTGELKLENRLPRSRSANSSGSSGSPCDAPSHSAFDRSPCNAFGQLAGNVRLTFIPELEESRVANVVSKKGPVYHLEMIGPKHKFVKRWLAVRRPYLYMYADNSQTDAIDVINLASTELLVCPQLEEIDTDQPLIDRNDNSPAGLAASSTGFALKRQRSVGSDCPSSLPISRYFHLKNELRHHVFQCVSRKDACDWLYAINPLLAGQIRSRQARTKR